MIQTKRTRKAWNRPITCMTEMKLAYKVLVRKPEGKRRLGKPGRRWKNQIRMNIEETGK
jgi:hypothetical protein